MTPPPSLTARLLATPWFGRALTRRLTFAALALVFAALSVYPRPYVAEAELAPPDDSAALSAALGQSGGLVDLAALANVRQPIEADLAVARSHVVLSAVIDRLGLAKDAAPEVRAALEAQLDAKLGVIAIRDSLLRISFEDRNPVFAQDMVATVAQVTRERLTALSRTQALDRRDPTAARLAANADMVVIEPAYVKPQRQFNVWAVCLLILTVMIAGGLELYGLQPSVGSRKPAPADA